MLEKDTAGRLIQFFISLSCRDAPDQSQAEKFICSLYGMKDAVKDVNEARYVKLCQMTRKIDKVTLTAYMTMVFQIPLLCILDARMY